MCKPTSINGHKLLDLAFWAVESWSWLRTVQLLSSQAARQGLAVLMASAVVVLKHEPSTVHNFISIDLTFGVSDYVREATSPDKVGSGPMSGRDATWGQHIRVLTFFFIFFNRATAHTRDQIFAHNSSKDAVWCKEDHFWDEKCVILKFWGVLL